MKFYSKPLFYIIIIGLLIRLVFLFWGADYLYPKSIFLFGDSQSYTDSFLNWWYHGVYGIWVDVPLSYAGRGPGYPLFWGLHYLIFGPNYVYLAVAISQILLDLFVIKLIYDIILKFSANFKFSLAGAILYAVYPFTIMWLSLTATESFAVFLTVLILWIYYIKEDNVWKYTILGFLVAYATLTRPYLGLFLAIIGIGILLKFRFKWVMVRWNAIFVLFFALTYSPWVIRNYIFLNQKVIFTSKGSGYHNFQDDFNSFREWVNAWEPYSALINQYRFQISEDTIRLEVPDFVFKDTEERQTFDSLIGKCRTCGSSFYYWRTYKVYQGTDCNEEIQQGFKSLKKSFIKNHPYHYYVYVPAKTFLNAVFKLKKEEGHNSIFFTLMLYRSFTVILGLIGLIWFVRKKDAFVLIGYPLLWYFYLCIGHTHFELRYLLQADVILLILGVLGVCEVLRVWGKVGGV